MADSIILHMTDSKILHMNKFTFNFTNLIGIKSKQIQHPSFCNVTDCDALINA